MNRTELTDAYERLCAHEDIAGSHVSLDRDRKGDESLNVVPDWIDAAGLAFVLDVGRELELAVSLTKEGLRLASQAHPLNLGVRHVRRVLAEDDE